MHLLYKRIFNLNLPIDLQLKLFDQTILPILTYSCEIWGFENIDMIERIHSDFLRKITSTRQSTPLYMLYGELGRYPISIIIKCRMIKFWNNLILSKVSKLSHISYKIMCNQQRHQFKWLISIKNILDTTGNSDLWINQSQIESRHVDKLVKQTLKDQFLQDWNTKLAASVLLATDPGLASYTKAKSKY